MHFQIALARYGEQGRRFVVVESVARPCVGREQIKPTDELVAVNGKVIVEPTSKDRLTELLRTIAGAPRPLTLTFVEGEDREKHTPPQPPSPAARLFGGWQTVRPVARRVAPKMPVVPAPRRTKSPVAMKRRSARRRCALAAAFAVVVCGAVAPAPRPPTPPPPRRVPWAPLAAAGAGALALARPEVRLAKPLVGLARAGRGLVVGAFAA